jgi:hypothetical protein
MIFADIFFGLLVFIAGWMIYSLPATLSLQRGIRPGIDKTTIEEAVKMLKASGNTGTELIKAARSVTITRMQYCRRNSFDSYKTAFERGYGYCQQQAHALKYILTQLGFNAWVVYANRNRFADGHAGGHAWVRIFYDGTQKDIDATYDDPVSDKITFTPLTKVKRYTPLFRLLAGWGSIAINASRYYLTGKDH